MRHDDGQVAEGGAGATPIGWPPASNGRLSAWLLGILAAGLVSIVVVAGASFGLASSGGFDLTDEAFYLLDARRPDDQFAAPRLHWILTAPLFRAVGGDLSWHRMAGATLLSAAGAWLALGLSGLPRGPAIEHSRTARRLAAAAVGAAASATFYAFAVRTPGYNWASLLLTTATLALIAWSAGRTRCWWSDGAGGLAAGLAMLPKLSTGLLLATSGLVASAVVGSVRDGAPNAWRRPVAWIANVLMGIGLGLGGLWVWSDPIETFRAGAEMLAPTALYGDLATRLRTESTELLELWWRDARVAVLAASGLAAMAGVLAWRRRPTAAAVVASAGLPIAVVVLGFLDLGWTDVPARPRMVLVSATLVAVSWIPQLGTPAVWRAWSRGDLLIAGGMLMLIMLLPLMTAAGTGNADYWRFASFGFWLLAASLPGLRNLAGAPVLVVAAGTGLLAVTALASTLVIRAPYSAPYRPPADASGVRARMEIYPGSGEIEIDEALARAIRELRRIAATAGMPAGQDVLACFDMPGLVLALDARAPGTSWLFSGYLRSDLAAERALASIPADRRLDAWVLVRRPQRAESRRLEGATPDLASLFDSIGRRFPEDYESVGSTVVPFYDRTASVELWRPRDDASANPDEASVSSSAAEKIHDDANGSETRGQVDAGDD